MTTKEILKRQIVYRSKHRGTKEMDLLLSNFVKRNIDKFGYKELKDLNNILSMDDDVIHNWYFNINSNEKVVQNKVSLMLKNFKI